MAKKFRFKNHKKSGITVSKKDIEQGMDAKQMEEYAKLLAPKALNSSSAALGFQAIANFLLDSA